MQQLLFFGIYVLYMLMYVSGEEIVYLNCPKPKGEDDLFHSSHGSYYCSLVKLDIHMAEVPNFIGGGGLWGSAVFGASKY